MKNTKKKNNITIIILIILVIILIVSLILLMTNKKENTKENENNYNNLKNIQEQKIVYDYQTENKEDKVPVINIKSEKIEKINKKIQDIYQIYLGSFKESFKYTYNISDNILSILIIANQRYNDSDNYDIKYETFNINLDTLEEMSDEEIFQKYNLKKDKVRFFITYKFLNYYNELVKLKYFTEDECDFNCFIETKEIYDFMDNNHYYINNGQLEVYKFFNIFTKYNEEKYFTEDSFHFIIM